jgi:signal recognition particle subunit SRP54
LITKIIYDELVHVLGDNQSEIKISGSGITVILIAGLQGSGKTTFSAKLAKKLKENQRKTLLVAADVYRPAAINSFKC